MKKNTIKKLALSKETVRTLEEQSVAKAAGGSYYCQTIGTNCDASYCVCA